MYNNIVFYFHPKDQLYMHLTNYSINKKNDNFDRTEDISAGSKRSLQYLKDMLRKEDIDVNTLWKNIAVSDNILKCRN